MARTNLVQDYKGLSRRGRLVVTLVMTGAMLIPVIGFLSAGIVKRLPRDWKNATCTVIEDPSICPLYESTLMFNPVQGL